MPIATAGAFDPDGLILHLSRCPNRGDMAAHCKDKFRAFWRRFQSNLKNNRFPVELGEAGSARRAAEVERITSKRTPPIDIR